MALEKLFEPFEIKGLRFKNRIIYPATVLNTADKFNCPTQDTIENYSLVAKTGVGGIIGEASCIREDQKITVGALGIYSFQQIPLYSKLVDAVKESIYPPPPFGIQLDAVGKETEPALTEREVVASWPTTSALHPVLGPTTLNQRMATLPRALSPDEIEELQNRWADAAQMAMIAGFDFVEMKCSHGYLCQNFLSPFTNKRTDKYGKDRALFLLEIIDKIRKRVGPNFPIFVRIGCTEGFPGGLTVEDQIKLAKRLEEAGVDAINISGGSYESGHLIIQPMMVPRGCHVENAYKIKQAVNIPVGVAGRINDPRLANEILEKGYVDFVCVCRSLYADREWIKKAREGRLEDIRYCIACNYCITDRVFGLKRARCTVNPAHGSPFGEEKFEEEAKREAAVKKKVFVVGGGPSGMKAAKIAAQRGHKVTIFEAQDKLGGNLHAAAAVYYKGEISSFTRYITKQIEKLGVEVKTNTTFTVDIALSEKPDVIIIATGAKVVVPDIPGKDKMKVYDCVDVLNDKVECGENVVVVGGDMMGMDTALYLVEQKNKKVTVLHERTDEFTLYDGLYLDMEALSRLWLLIYHLPTVKGIEIIPFARPVEIKDEEIVYEDVRSGEKKSVSCDTVVFAKDRQSVCELKDDLEKNGFEVYVIGDAVSPRKLPEAIREGALVGKMI